jgi:DNA-binding LacI/PurR family transcriptional regulator
MRSNATKMANAVQCLPWIANTTVLWLSDRMSSGAEPGERPAAVTLADVAGRAGVAVSTASRALANPMRVSAATRERIATIAAELGYRAAPPRTPAASRARAIGVLVPDVTNPFYFGIIHGTQQQAKAAGLAQILVDTEESAELEEDALERLRGTFDGAVLAASRLTDARLAELSARMPVVAINRQVAGVPSVSIDTPRGIVQAVEHLASLGHRSVAYLSGPTASRPDAARWRAVQRTARRHGLRAVRLGPLSPTLAAGREAADAVVNTGVSACIAYNDLLAIGLLMRLRERAIDVPGDLSVVGCDDIFGAEFAPPPLTTLSAPVERAGRTAVSLLLARLQSAGQAAAARREAVVLPTHLTVRASTGPARRRP